MSETQKQPDIYRLGLHGHCGLGDAGLQGYVIRVPGGWIYEFHTEGQITHAFVPFNNEFQRG